MYYSETFFQKDIYQINENDILNFFANSPEESSILELKSGGTLQIEKVYPEVCALHNTQGGLIIIGSPKPRKVAEREYFDGDLTRSPFKDKDWVYQKISSNISPVPSGIKIHDVRMTDGKYVQIIDVPKSLHPPHQCSLNGIYYLRFETQSRFAPHGLVEALFNKRQEPSVKCDIMNFNFRPDSPFEFDIQISNASLYPIIGISVLAKFYNIDDCAKSGKIQGTFDRLFCALEPINDLLYFTEVNNRNTTTVVKGLSSLFRYYITTDNRPFVAQISVWSTNMNLNQFGFIISPRNNKQISFKIENDIFSDAAAKVEDLLIIEDDYYIINGLTNLLEKLKNKNF